MAYRRTPEVEARLRAVRERIVVATVELVAAGGWEAASVAGVAARAGVATGTVYRHVEDKDALFAEAFRRAAGAELEHVQRVVTGAPGTATQRIEAGLRAFAERALRGRRLAYALLTEPASPGVEAERLAFRRGYRMVFAEALREGLVADELAPHDPELLAAVLTGAMGEALVQPLGPVHAADSAAAISRAVDELVAACLRCLPAINEEERHVVHP